MVSNMASSRHGRGAGCRKRNTAHSEAKALGTAACTFGASLVLRRGRLSAFVPRAKETPMTIALNHTIVPARDKAEAAKFFARMFGLGRGRSSYFAPVRVNKSLTFLFSDDEKSFESHHYAFHVSEREFDAIFKRVKKAGITYGSAPGSPKDGKLNDWGGGRGFYFESPDGHLLELMTVPQ
jgi:catechol 2,3-dioxygenase-like lactoylglutathione lyase family enzyme